VPLLAHMGGWGLRHTPASKELSVRAKITFGRAGVPFLIRPGAGHWAVPTPGPVLLLAAEDPLAVVVQRLTALAAARARALATLPVDLIVEPVVRLPDGLERLAATVAQRRPVLLILDPLIRVHRADENSAPEMAAILDGLRALARDAACAVLLVHHTRKAPALSSPGHGLRGSSDLHAFGDSNLYLRRLGAEGPLELRIEHRAAACPPPLRLRLRVTADTAHFVLADDTPTNPLHERLLTLVRRAPAPLSTATLRQTLGVRKQVLVDLLRTLVAEGRLARAGREGWTAPPPVPVPPPMGGNGNADAAPSSH
jgi:hypothetical protein